MPTTTHTLSIPAGVPVASMVRSLGRSGVPEGSGTVSERDACDGQSGGVGGEDCVAVGVLGCQVAGRQDRAGGDGQRKPVKLRERSWARNERADSWI